MPARRSALRNVVGTVADDFPISSATGVRSVLDSHGLIVEVPVTQLADLKPGMNGVAPVLIEDEYFTCRVIDGWRFEV